ncbi:MAG: hypothetical protein Q9M36_14945 [Sulfurovum sp.]|nr:hypothetical protein [Sulfurovum sp.]
MNHTIFQTPEYQTLLTSHILQTIEYLFKKDQPFSIACEIRFTAFNPALPTEIQNSFNETVLFVLDGYTFESASIDSEYFSFEAGFGANNFGSNVLVPLLAIKQVYVEDTPIILNFTQYVPSLKKQEIPSKKRAQTSMESLLNNPKNKKLLKKKS